MAPAHSTWEGEASGTFLKLKEQISGHTDWDWSYSQTSPGYQRPLLPL